MSKAIKWQIPFASLSGTLYRIDIYAEGYSGDPIQLTAGESPFVTEEDSSEDFFAPIRTQTGSIQVCTRKPDGTMLTLDEILPANNIDHPVRLINLSNSNAIEWQGFLSCEAYSQNYTAIPENLTLSVISVLEAMDSVQLDQTRSSGLATIAAATYNALNEIVVQSGMDFFTHIRYSMTSWRIFNKYIDQTVFFERKEYDNENSTTYIVSGLSAKSALERLCTFMGWTAREQGTQLYLEYIGESIGMYQETFSGFGSNFHPSGTPSAQITSGDIADFDWRGTDHKRDIRQGAKSVAVAAKLEKYDMQLSLPEFPYGSVEDFYKKFSYTDWLYLVASLNASAYSNLSFQYFKGTINIPQNVQTYNGTTNLAEVLQRMIAGTNNSLDEINVGIASTPPFQAVVAAGAFLAQAAYETQEQAAHSTEDGLYCVWLPQAWNTPSHYNPETGYFVNTDVFEDLGYIFKMYTPLATSMTNGYLRISAAMTHIIYQYENYHDAGYFIKKTSEWEDKLLLHIKVGNKYWTGSQWSTTPTKVWVDIDGSNFKKNWTPSMPVVETDGFLIPISGVMRGQVEIAIYSPIHAMDKGFEFLAETFFSKLDVDYLLNDNSLLTDRGENHYFRLLGTNFRDEINVSAELASMLNNQSSPSLIMDDATTPASSIDYTVSGGTEPRRPEVDLLNRLASYYGAARQTLDLITKHPTAAVLPLLKLNGIGDGKTYLPLSESRDWRNEECTLKCFEMPGTPSES